MNTACEKNNTGKKSEACNEVACVFVPDSHKGVHSNEINKPTVLDDMRPGNEVAERAEGNDSAKSGASVVENCAVTLPRRRVSCSEEEDWDKASGDGKEQAVTSVVENCAVTLPRRVSCLEEDWDEASCDGKEQAVNNESHNLSTVDNKMEIWAAVSKEVLSKELDMVIAGTPEYKAAESDAVRPAEGTGVAQNGIQGQYRDAEDISDESESELENFNEDSTSEASSSTSSSTMTSNSETESDAEEKESTSNKSKPAKTVPRTKGELLPEDLPPIQDLKISVPESECLEVGKVLNIVDRLVVVQAFKNTPPLDLDSVLFLDRGKRALGEVFDVFGPVKEPLYCVRFNSREHIDEKGIEKDMLVYCAPKSDHTSYVFLPDLLKMKGSDASWEHNNEPPLRYMDFSDDEEERRVMKKIRNSNKKNQESEDDEEAQRKKRIKFERKMNVKNLQMSEKWKKAQNGNSWNNAGTSFGNTSTNRTPFSPPFEPRPRVPFSSFSQVPLIRQPTFHPRQQNVQPCLGGSLLFSSFIPSPPPPPQMGSVPSTVPGGVRPSPIPLSISSGISPSLTSPPQMRPSMLGPSASAVTSSVRCPRGPLVPRQQQRVSPSPRNVMQPLPSAFGSLPPYSSAQMNRPSWPAQLPFHPTNSSMVPFPGYSCPRFGSTRTTSPPQFQATSAYGLPPPPAPSMQPFSPRGAVGPQVMRPRGFSPNFSGKPFPPSWS